jgi:hypothetical protein
MVDRSGWMKASGGTDEHFSTILFVGLLYVVPGTSTCAVKINGRESAAGGGSSSLNQ